MIVSRLLALLGVVSLSQAAPSLAFDLTSSAFAPGAAIPKKHTCDGDDRSPPLAWTEPPPGTRSFALVCEDPDAPAGTWTHWVLYAVPGNIRALSEGVPPQPTLGDASRQGKNDFRRVGWGGPCPPPGSTHRYVFKLHALDVVPELAPGASRAELLKAIEGHVLGTAELTGRYGR